VRMLVVCVDTVPTDSLARAYRAVVLGSVFGLIAVVGWLLLVVPAVVGFGLSVAFSVAWCIWLEKHPEAPSSSPSSKQPAIKSRTASESDNPEPLCRLRDMHRRVRLPLPTTALASASTLGKFRQRTEPGAEPRGPAEGSPRS
jgi:hypothetical protein